MSGPGVVYGTETQLPLSVTLAGLLDLPVGRVTTGTYSDGETQVRFHDELWGRSVILVVSTCPPVPANLMTLALMADAARRNGAARVIAVVPYFGYARGERMASPGMPIAARVAASLIQASGATHLVTVDLHSPAIVGFFTIPVIEVSAVEALAARFTNLAPEHGLAVAPDAGAMKRVSRFAEILNLPMAVSVKQRIQPDAPKLLHVWGDMAGRTAVIVDDMISSGATVSLAGAYLRDHGATSIDVAATHAVLSAGADARLLGIPTRRLVVTDTIPGHAALVGIDVEVVPIAPLLAPAVASCLA